LFEFVYNRNSVLKSISVGSADLLRFLLLAAAAAAAAADYYRHHRCYDADYDGDADAVVDDDDDNYEDEDDDDDDDALFLRTPPPRIQLQNAANDHDEDHEDDKYRVDDDSRDADSNLSARAAPFFPTFVIIHRYLNHERRCVLVCATSNLMCLRVTHQI